MAEFGTAGALGLRLRRISRVPSLRAITRERWLPSENSIAEADLLQKPRHIRYIIWLALAGASHLEVAEILVIQVSLLILTPVVMKI
jgi:hypothetical protein